MRGHLVLFATVLAAIGIGVGVESALTPAAFGPAEARFYAAFPGPVSLQRSSLPAAHVRRAWTYTGTSSSAQLVVSALQLPPSPPGEGSSAFLLLPGTHTPTIPPRDMRPTPEAIDGLAAVRVVGCLPRAPKGRNRCAGSVSVSPPGSRTYRIQWTAAASGLSAARVEQLLASFAPVRG